MKPQANTVTIIAPARLHMGFLDLSGALGRHYGSVGLAINELSTQLSMTQAPSRIVTGPCSLRAERCLLQFCQALSVSDQLHVDITSAIPEHVGLGSGTQMALAIGQAINNLYGLGLSVRELATIVDRGLRSGIGIGVFEQGGLIVDGGRGVDTQVPPILARMAVPESWRFILVFDRRGQGLHGQKELQAFAELPPFPQQEAARLCYLMLMQGLPAVAENNIHSFGDVVSQLQQSVGQHFAPAQGGIFASSNVSQAVQWLSGQGAVALGQTSWGPTGFCAVDGEEIAQTLLHGVQQQFSHIQELHFCLASVRNTGAEIITTA